MLAIILGKNADYCILRKLYTLLILYDVVFEIVALPEGVLTHRPGYGDLYDLYKQRFRNLKNFNEFSIENILQDANKRSLHSSTNKGEYKQGTRSLYDEFKKRLDNFNDALKVNDNTELNNSDDKRSTIDYSFYDRFKSRLYGTNNILSFDSNFENDDNISNRNSREFFSIFVTKRPRKENILIDNNLKNKKERVQINKKKMVDKTSTNKKNKIFSRSSISLPYSDFTRNKKELNDWTDGDIFNEDKNRIQRSSSYNDNYFIWQKLNTLPSSQSIEDLINQCNMENFKVKASKVKKREVKPFIKNNNNTSRTKNSIETMLPFGTNDLSLYPLVLTVESVQLHNQLNNNGSVMLSKYAELMNVSVLELAKALVKANAFDIESNMKAIHKHNIIDNGTDMPQLNLEHTSLQVLKNIMVNMLTTNSSGIRARVPKLVNNSLLLPNTIVEHSNKSSSSTIHHFILIPIW